MSLIPLDRDLVLELLVVHFPQTSGIGTGGIYCSCDQYGDHADDDAAMRRWAVHVLDSAIFPVDG